MFHAVRQFDQREVCWLGGIVVETQPLNARQVLHLYTQKKICATTQGLNVVAGFIDDKKYIKHVNARARGGSVRKYKKVREIVVFPLEFVGVLWDRSLSLGMSGETRRFPRMSLFLGRDCRKLVIINWVQYLGPPGPFSFPDSRDLLEVLGGLPWQRESPREDPLGSGRIP